MMYLHSCKEVLNVQDRDPSFIRINSKGDESSSTGKDKKNQLQSKYDLPNARYFLLILKNDLFKI